MSLPARAIQQLATLVTARPRAVLVVSTLLAMLGAWLGATRLAIDADTDSLISPDRPFMRGYRAFKEEFGDLEGVVIAVDGMRERGVVADDAQSAVDAIADAMRVLEATGHVQWWAARIEPYEQWRLATWSASDDELEALAASAQEIVAIARGDASANPLVAAGLNRRREPEYLRAEGGTFLFVEAMPTKDFSLLDPVGASIRAIRASIESIAKLHPTVRIGLTGKPVLQHDEMKTANLDMARASAGSLAVITVLFIIVFRGVRRPLLAVAAFVIASGWTYGAATLLVGHLNLLSTVFMLVLVGAGLDYGVHVVSRFSEMRRTMPRSTAVRAALITIAPGTLSGAVGSAVVFFLALTTDFGGLRELGIIAGVGLLLCAIAMVTVLPALLALFDASADPKPSTRPATLTLPRRLPLPLVLVPVVSCLALIPWSLGFQSNLLDLQSQDLESVRWERRIFDDSASASWFAVSIVEDFDAVARMTANAQSRPEILKTESVLDIVRIDTPTRVKLRQQIASIANAPIAPLVEPTPASEAARAILDGARVSLREALPAAVRARMISPNGNFLVRYLPREDAWEEAPLERFVHAIRTVDPAATGVPITQLESIRDMRHAFITVSWLSVIAVFAIAWIDFRRFGAALIATATVLAGVAMALGIMPLFGAQLNLANFFAIPMLIGLGIDSAIHLLHRWREQPENLGPTIRAVAFTALTTAIGFGALIFAQHRGMRSLGVAMGVGSLTCMYVACVVLPVLLARYGTISGSTPSGSAAMNRLP